MELQQPDGVLTAEMRSDAVVARFTSEVILSGARADVASKWLTALLSQAGQLPMLIDFGNVRSLTSLMLGKLAELGRAADSAGVRLALFNLRPDVREILEVTGLNLILRLYDSEQEALKGP
jgi:anti-sigma B factor antagonist